MSLAHGATTATDGSHLRTTSEPLAVSAHPQRIAITDQPDASLASKYKGGRLGNYGDPVVAKWVLAVARLSSETTPQQINRDLWSVGANSGIVRVEWLIAKIVGITWDVTQILHRSPRARQDAVLKS